MQANTPPKHTHTQTHLHTRRTIKQQSNNNIRRRLSFNVINGAARGREWERETGTACLQFVCQSVCLSVCLSGCLGINACPAKARKIERNITRVSERERKDVLVSSASLKLFNSLQQQQQKGKKWCKIELSKKLQCKIIIEKNYQQQ